MRRTLIRLLPAMAICAAAGLTALAFGTAKGTINYKAKKGDVAVTVTHHRHVGVRDLSVRRQRIGDRLDRVVDDPRLHAQALSTLARQRRHLGVVEAHLLELAAHLGDVGILAVGHLDLPRRAALEVDAEVEPAEHEQAEAEHDERGGEDQPPLAVLDELEVGALVVQVFERVPARDTGNTAVGRSVQRRVGHARSSGVSRPDAMPTPRMRTNAGLRDINATIGCMTKYAIPRSMSTEIPRKSAKFFTPPSDR